MLVLLIAGIGLLLFGGIVLLKFPDKPGGRITMGTVEVSSVGAGLPLMVLGVVCLFAYTGAGTGIGGLNFWPFRPEGPELPPDVAGGCFEAYFEGVPAERVAVLEAGVQDIDLLGSGQSGDAPAGIVFTRGGTPVGALTYRFFTGSDLFRIASVVDGACEPVTAFANTSRGGDPEVLQNWDTLEMEIGGRSYFLRLGYDGGVVSVNYFR